MDRKEKKGNPWEGPMKRIDPPASLPAPPDISTIIEEPKEEPKQLTEDQRRMENLKNGLCPCGFPRELCEQYNGNQLLIALHMAGAIVVQVDE